MHVSTIVKDGKVARLEGLQEREHSQFKRLVDALVWEDPDLSERAKASIVRHAKACPAWLAELHPEGQQAVRNLIGLLRAE